MAAGDEEQQLTIISEKLMGDSFQVLNRMQKDRKLCDVILIAEDKEIPAHKCVLASCSPYFYSMFVNSACKTEERIKMDVNPEALLLIIDYMYTSQLTVPEGTLKDVLEVAKLLLLNNLQIDCCNFLKRIINTNNSFYMKTLAITYGDSELLTEISSFIDANFADISTSDEFLNLTNDEVKDLICRDSLRVPCEENVYECVLRWIKHDLRGRRKYVRSLMEHVRLSFISNKYLSEHIVNDPLLAGDIYCKDLIIKVLLENQLGSSLELKHRKYTTTPQVMLVIGGNTEESQNTLEFYDFEKKVWSEVLKIPFNVGGAKLEVIDQKIYLIGGCRDGTTAQTVSSYNFALNNWQNISNMLEKRSEHGVAKLNNSIYVFGGWNDRRSLNLGEKFCHEDNKWISIASMSTNRSEFGTCVVNDIAYVVGGFDKFFSPLNSVESYDHRQNKWSQLCHMKECRRGLGVCAIDGMVYAIGGWNLNRKALRTAEKYNPETNSWVDITPMNQARRDFDVAIKDHHIYVVGGYSDTSAMMNSVEVYDIKSNTWTMLSMPMSVGRSSHCVAIVDRIDT